MIASLAGTNDVQKKRVKKRLSGREKRDRDDARESGTKVIATAQFRDSENVR